MTETVQATEPALKLKFLSHGTLESKDLEAARKFYAEFLGFEVIRTSNISLMIRLGGHNIYAFVENRKRDSEMPFLSHNGIDVSTEEEVNECHRLCVEQADKWASRGSARPWFNTGPIVFISGTLTVTPGKSFVIPRVVTPGFSSRASKRAGGT